MWLTVRISTRITFGHIRIGKFSAVLPLDHLPEGVRSRQDVHQGL